MKNAILLIITLFFYCSSYGQISVKDKMANSKNFFETQKELDAYFRTKKKSDPLKGREMDNEWHKYQRWQYHMRDRIYPDGSFNDQMETITKKQATENSKGERINLWTCINQTQGEGGYNGMGRATSVAPHPTDVNIVYVGTQGGGLWKTTDKGLTYKPLTDELPVAAAENIVLDPISPNTIYISLNRNRSFGIYKSTDGGENWNPTGLTFEKSASVNVRKVIISQFHSEILYAATSIGLFKTTNSGDTWEKVLSANCNSVVFKPGSDTDVYAALRAAPSSVMKSTDSGENWDLVYEFPTNWSSPNLEVSIADENFIAACNSSQIFSSSDNGDTWEAKGSMADGSEFTISPTNTDIMMGGYLNVYRTEDGGTTWTQMSMWHGGSEFPTVHADQQDYAYSPVDTSTLFIVNDGGMYIWDESSKAFTERTEGLIITMYYDIKASQTSPYIVTGGTQDNGGRKMNADGSWRATNGGDAMTQVIDPSNSDIFYTTYCNGVLYRTTNGGKSLTTISKNIPGDDLPSADWAAPYRLDPNNLAKIIAGYDALWISPDRGDTWTKISDNYNFGGTIQEMGVTKANSNVIYVSRGSKVFKSVNGGKDWTLYNLSNQTGGQRITYIEVSPTDANTLWVTCSGYSVGKKVLKSVNGGVNWTNISGTLPNVPINTIIYEKESEDRVYIGTDCGGIYFRDSSMPDWAFYGDGMPNSNITTLDIRYSDGKLYAGTWGRGIWQSNTVGASETTIPYADFSASNINILEGENVSFSDLSTNTATSWQWDFPGGTPATSNLKSPTIKYTTPGDYNVSLTVSNSKGNNTQTKTALIHVAENSNYCLDFDATNDYVNIPGVFSSPQSQFTIEFWIKPSSFTNWNNQFGMGWGKLLMHANSNGSLSVGTYGRSSDRINSDAGVLTLNKWQHVAYTYNAGAGYLYLNGEQIGQNLGGESTAPAWNGFKIGLNGKNTINGRVDEFRIWDVARNQTEIKTIMGAELADPSIENNLLVYYKFNSSAGSVVSNEMSGYQGTLTNMDNSDWVPSTVFNKETILPIARFNASKTTVDPGQIVDFSDISSGNPTQWQWSFENGLPATSDEQNPQVTYNTSGIYNVSLTVTNSDGSNTLTKSNLIKVSGPIPVVEFNSDNSTIVTGESIDFNDISTNTPSIWAWHFEGSNTPYSILQHPTEIVYNTPGVYSVSLKSSNAYGSNEVTKTSSVTVTALDNKIDKKKWTLKYVDSQHSTNQGFNALDNSNSTIWHSQYSPTLIQLPHEIQIDLHGNYNFTGFAYLPRQDGPNGRIKDYEFYVSTDGISWGTPVRKGNWINSTNEMSQGFPTKLGRYVRLVALSEVNGGPWSSIANIEIFGTESETSSSIIDELRVKIYSQEKMVYINMKDIAFANVYLYDIYGTLLDSQVVHSGLNQINTLQHKGIYIVKVVYGNNTFTEKVVIK